MSTRFVQKSNPATNSGIINYIKMNWVLILAILLVVPFLYRYISELLAKAKAQTLKNETIVSNAQNAKSSPTIISQKSFDIFKKYPKVKPPEMERYKTVAQKIAIALGTNVEDNHLVFGMVDLYNVNSWVEDENEVVKLLKTVPTTFPIVEDLYYHVFTKSRNLKNDLLSYLSKSDLEKVRSTQKRYGKNFI